MNNSNAKRVTVKVVPRSTADGSSDKLRQELQAEINRYKVSIDRSVFRKTAEEKLELKELKSEWKKSQK